MTKRMLGRSLLAILVLNAVGAAIGMLTQPAGDMWYTLLAKPVFTPPNWVFAVVWPVLYACIAVAGVLLWQGRRRPLGRVRLALFAIQLLMNWAWSFLFFSAHLLAFSLGWLVALNGVVFTLIALSARARPVAAWLLVPYQFWIAYAAFLNLAIWQMNG